VQKADLMVFAPLVLIDLLAKKPTRGPDDHRRLFIGISSFRLWAAGSTLVPQNALVDAFSFFIVYVLLGFVALVSTGLSGPHRVCRSFSFSPC
jgi:hypothetical protein